MDFPFETAKGERPNPPATEIQIDFPSEGTKKERRSLLASGFAGIIIGFLRIKPTEIEVLGMKFSNPDLPLVAIGALAATIVYLCVKFVTSYFYEWSRLEKLNLVVQIREGQSATDVMKEEETTRQLSLHVIEQRKIVQKRMENDENRFKEREKALFDFDAIYSNAMQELDKERAGLLEKYSDAKHDMNNPAIAILRPGYLSTLEGEISDLENRKNKLRAVTKADQEKKLADLEQERKQRAELNAAELRQLDSWDADAITRSLSIVKWKKAHKTSDVVSPVNRFLELIFPLLVAGVGLGFLGWLAFHFPDPKPPISLPPI